MIIPQFPVSLGDQTFQFIFVGQLIKITELFGDDLIKYHPSHCGLLKLFLYFDLYLSLEPHLFGIVGRDHLVCRKEYFPFASLTRFFLSKIIAAQDNILAGSGNGVTAGGRQKIIYRKHQYLGLQLRLKGKWNMHRHLISIEVCVKSRANQRMQLYRLSLHQDRIKSLNSQSMQGGSTIEKNGMIGNYLL